jgi:Ca2+-binding EF-hand superfamily protein
VGFEGNIAGAWRALDDDLSGYISLAEIDPAASGTLSNFKAWADEEFGGVRAAFTVFDNDGSNEVTYREFKRTCRSYGFDCQDVRSVFQALDVENNGNLSVEEVMFLDDWEFAVSDSVEDKTEAEETPAEKSSHLGFDSNCTRYETIGPGPAAYMLQSTIGAGPAAPMLRYRGAFSFRKKMPHHQLPGIPKDITPSPANYDVASVPFAVTVARDKPAWAFGSAERMLTRGKDDTPGPGEYYHLLLDRRQHNGPAAICSPRRPLKVHPLFKARRPMTVDAVSGACWSAR